MIPFQVIFLNEVIDMNGQSSLTEVLKYYIWYNIIVMNCHTYIVHHKVWECKNDSCNTNHYSMKLIQCFAAHPVYLHVKVKGELIPFKITSEKSRMTLFITGSSQSFTFTTNFGHEGTKLKMCYIEFMLQLC